MKNIQGRIEKLEKVAGIDDVKFSVVLIDADGSVKHNGREITEEELEELRKETKVIHVASASYMMRHSSHQG